MSNELAIMQTLTPAIFNPVKDGEKKGIDSLLEKVKEEVAHKTNVDNQIVQELLDLGLGNVVAETIVERISSGAISYVKINY